MKNKTIIILISLTLALLIALPSCFATDNDSPSISKPQYSLDNNHNSISTSNSNSNNLIKDTTKSEQKNENTNSEINKYKNNINNSKTKETDENILQNNEYYFNSSVDEDNGDGSINHPYKNLTSDRIPSNSIIHLSNGNYSLDKQVSANNIQLIGTNANETIIEYNGIGFVSTSLTLINLTLSSMTIKNNGQLTATNTIFKNGKGYTEDSYGNNFGGAIYSKTGNAYIDLTQCKFINNSAGYGGAIYMDDGVLNIKDSYFINNTAFNFGGAIALEYNQEVTINGSEFIGDKSHNDAGGAIYLKGSSLNGNNLIFTNCEADFGSGLTSLNSEVSLNAVTAENNIAKYYGGVIYHMYCDFSLTNSSFNNNSACIGGALFIDNSTSFSLVSNTFTDNKASYIAGAVYSISNIVKNLTDNSFNGNEAPLFNDSYETDKIDLNIGNGNYTLYVYNNTEIGDLPTYYNLVDLGQVTSVKDQEDGGNCWAYSALAALESCILKASGEALDLSVDNMKNIMAFYSDYGWVIDANSGGNEAMAIAYLVSWLGPVLEEFDLNDDKGSLSPLLNSIMHIQNVLFLGRESYTDNDAIKEAIMKYGAVSTSFYHNSNYQKGFNYYCDNPSRNPNHAVAIVGWDDTYSKNNFKNQPAGDGAWIVKNSWGSDWGAGGYFYVSYYDETFAKVGDMSASYTFILNDTIKIDKNYQYDISGQTDYFYNTSSSVWYKNVFNSTNNELLSAVSTYFERLTNWNLTIKVNDEIKLQQTGTSNAGYYTIHLNEFIPLKIGDIFQVIFNINVDGDAGFPISEKIQFNKIAYDKNISFVSYDGENWLDLYDLKWEYPSHTYDSQVACIKAFTISTGVETKLELDINYNNYNPVTITAHITDQYGRLVNSGNVGFILNGKEVVVDVISGIAQLIYNFDKKENNITATYNGIGYNQSTNNTTVTITTMDVNLDLNIIPYSNTVTINVTSDQKINTTVKVLINDDEYEIELIDGEGTLRFENLLNNEYIVNASLNNKEIFNSEEVTNSFAIKVITTKITAENFTTDDYSSALYEIILTNESSNPIVGKIIYFNLDNKTYNATTDENGKANIPINLTGGEYLIKIYFNGDEDYANSQINSTIKVKDKVKVNIEFNQNINDLEIIVKLDKRINETIKLTFNNETYNITTKDGEAKLKFENLTNTGYNTTAELLNTDDYIANITSENIEIKVNNLTIILNPMNTTDNSNEYYIIRLIDNETNPLTGKTIKIILNNEIITKETINGEVSIPINLVGGDYEILVEFDGDNNFFKATNKSTIKVKDKIIINPTISLDSDNALINIKLSKSINESLNIILTNMDKNSIKTYNITTYNGNGVLKLNDLENGNYNLSIQLLGKDKYVSNVTYSKFSINLSKSNIITKDIVSSDYSNKMYWISLVDASNNPIANKKISITLNGKTYTKTTNNEGSTYIQINLGIGTYKITTMFAGDNKYRKSNVTNTIKVIERITGDINVDSVFDKAVINIKFSKKFNETTNILINNKYYPVKLINGEGSLNLNNLNEGKYNITLNIEKYDISLNKSFNINKEVNIVSTNFTTYHKSNSLYTVSLMNNKKPLANKTVTFRLNGKTFTRTTNNNGKASININLNVGNYKLTIEFEKEVKTNNIKVIAPISKNKDLIKYYGNTKGYTVLILGDNGQTAGANKIVTMKINGRTYKVKTNQNGLATLKLNLKPKTYKITAEYNGYAVSNKVTIKPTIITKNITKKKAPVIKYTAKLVNSNGKIIKNKKITFKIKGKTYKIKTNKNGIATLSLKSLKVGKYKITSTYGKLTVNNIIIIKR